MVLEVPEETEGTVYYTRRNGETETIFERRSPLLRFSV